MDLLIKLIFNDICDRMYTDLDTDKLIDIAYVKDKYQTAENIETELKKYIANYFNNER